MFHFVDDFLPEELFNSLNTRILQRYKPNLKKYSMAVANSNTIRIRAHSDNNDYTEAAMLLGVMVPEVLQLIREYGKYNLKWIEPEAQSIWFQYNLNTDEPIGKHHDVGSLRERKPPQCFSTLLYSHKEWNTDWGGELCLHGAELLPKPNRLVIYSRDEEHWVNPIKHVINDYKRMFLGCSWSTDSEM